MTLMMTFYVISANLDVCSNEMAEKAMFESIKSGQSLLKKDVFGKGKVPSGNTILCGHRKNSYKDLQTSETVGKTLKCEPFLSIKVAHKLFR